MLILQSFLTHFLCRFGGEESCGFGFESVAKCENEFESGKSRGYEIFGAVGSLAIFGKIGVKNPKCFFSHFFFIFRFYLAGYGCQTCIGNSGPLPEPVAQVVDAVNI